MGVLSFSSSFPSFSLLLPRLRSDPRPKPPSIIEMRQMDGKKKKKDRSTLVRLVSSAGTGFFYVTKLSKNAKEKFSGDKFQIRKFDPRVRRHVLFTESKIK